MIKSLFKILLILICLISTHNVYASNYQYLHDNWTLHQARFPIIYKATIPGVVHLDLLKNKIIEDPYVGMNERSIQWIDKEDWIYETSFIPDKKIYESKHIIITFNGLDTYADVYLNGKKIIEANNMFRRWTTDVKQYLLAGRNHLKVYFHSPIKIALPQWESLPFNYNASNDQSENGGVFDRKLSVFTRKAGYHYGWDWGPRLVTSGIWRSVFLKGWNDANIKDIHIQQNYVSQSKALLTNNINIEADRDIKNVKIVIKEESSGRILISRNHNLIKGDNTISLDFSIKNPRLWWCNGMGKPELYSLCTTIIKNNRVIAQKRERIGIRSIKVVTTPDANGNMQFYFVLNNKPVFAKGTNYIPMDNFLPRVTRKQYESLLRDAVDANMNMIRVWGGGIYENDEFYDICDEMGLMVWQDFMFACSIYPAYGDWLENVRQEAIDNVCRLRNHPSIVLWCGGNECLDAWYNWGWKNKYKQEYAKRIESEANNLYFEILPSVVNKFAPKTFYWPSSPFSGKNKGSDGKNGDFHYYGVWQRKFPIDTYNHIFSHFFSEYGMQSFPEINTIRKFAPNEKNNNINIHSDVIMWHQRGGNKANELIAWYLKNEYRSPKDFQEFIYMSQLLQGDAMRTAIEAHRRARPYCMGSLLWQHNDCWPVASWSTRDYFGNWKAAHYMVRKAFSNIITSAQTTSDSLKVYVISDLLKEQKGNLNITFYSLDGSKLYQIENLVDIPANNSKIVWKGILSNYIQGVNKNNIIINIGISAGDYVYENNFYLCKQKDLCYLPAKISYIVKPINGGYKIIIKAYNFVRALSLSVEGKSCHFDDNYFDLLPGITKTCTVHTPLSLEDFKSRLRLKSFN